MCALCIGNVAATKSTKDKGFSKVLISVFIRAKVGRKELCQGGGVLFLGSDERRGFEVGAIEMRAVWRAELRGGAWGLSFCGRGGMPEPLFMGRGMVLLGWQRGRGLVKGDLSYGRGVEG